MSTFRLRTVIAAPLEACFDLSLSVEPHTSSMRDSGERIVDGVRSGSMALGDTVTWRARHFGVPWTMTSKITEFERPTMFVDEQVSGPFRSWHHRHLFRPLDSGTEMIDEVRMRSPLGVLGQFADRAVLRHYLHGLLTTRNEWLRQELERPR